MNDDLTIPFELDLNKNPDAAARRERQRSEPFTPTTFTISQDDQRQRDAELAAFLAAEAERQRIEKENSLAKMKVKKESQTKVEVGGRYDSLRNKWITPEQDFAMMAECAGMMIDSLRFHFEVVANHPDYPANGCKAFAKRILASLDHEKLAIENQKALERARRIARARAKGVKPRNRRAA